MPWILFAAFAALGVAALALLRRVLASAAGELEQANARLQEANQSLARANEDLHATANPGCMRSKRTCREIHIADFLSRSFGADRPIR